MAKMSLNNRVNKWVGECLRKKKLKEGWAEGIIVKARRDKIFLKKYLCPHCFHWHVTKEKNYKGD